jgi:hypothetical protein
VFYCRTAFALGLFAAMVVSANAQPTDAKPTPVSSVHVLIVFVGDQNIQKELKLTPEQLKKLRAHQQKLWDDQSNTPRKEYTAKADERHKATEALFKDTLDAEQYKRAEQLAIQYEWSQPQYFNGPFAQRRERVVDASRVSPAVLKQYPALADALKLSDVQKNLLEARRTLREPHYIILTPEQSGTAQLLFGKIVTRDWKADADPNARPATLVAFGQAIIPGPLGLTAAQDVRNELKLTEEQTNELTKLRAPWTQFRTEQRELSPVDAKKRSDELHAATDKALATILKPEQLTRLRQIELRDVRETPLRPLTEAPTSLIPRLVKQLAVTADQLKAFDEVRAKHAAAVTQAALSTGSLEAAWKAIRAANEAREKGFEAVLTDNQRADLKALVGEPFTGSVLPDDLTMRSSEQLRATRAASFGQYTDELTLLMVNKSIQSELKLTVDQINASKDARQEEFKQFQREPISGLLPKKGEFDPDKRSKFIETSLTAILDKDQAKRFRQIMLQRCQRQESVFEIPSAITYPSVAESVKLTAEQKKQLLNGEEPFDVLTDEQWKAIKDMLGEPFTGDYSIRAIRPVGKGGPGEFPTTSRTPTPTEVRAQFLVIVPWDALKLTPEQVSKLAPAINTYEIAAARSNGLGGPGGVKGTRDTHEVAARALDLDVKQILTDKQISRLDQLLLQSVAAVDLHDALTRPEAARLQLTPTQIARITITEDEMGKIAERVVKSYMLFDKRNEVLKELRERLDTRLLGVLTPEQLTKWNSLTGEKWDGFAKPLLTRTPFLRFGQ